MNRGEHRLTWSRWLVTLFLASHLMACSFVLVSPPPKSKKQFTAQSAQECTSSVGAPVVDTVLSVAGLGVIASAAQTSSTEANGSDGSTASGDGEAQMIGGIITTVLFAGSAVYGFANTAECREVNRQLESEALAAGDEQ